MSQPSNPSEAKLVNFSAFAVLIAVVLVFGGIFFAHSVSLHPAYSVEFRFAAVVTVLVSVVIAGSRFVVSGSLGFTRVDAIVICFLLYIMLRFLTTDHTYLNQAAPSWTMAMALGYTIFRSRLMPGNVVIMGLLFLSLSQIVWGQLQLLNILPSLHAGFALTGSFFNPAPYAGFLVVIFPFALTAVVQKERFGINRPLGYVVAAGTLLLIVPTQSRAAFLAIVGGTLWVVISHFQLGKKIAEWSGRTIVLTGAGTLLLSVTALSGLYYLKPASASGRLLIWKVATDMWREAPVFGLGTGKFAAQYNHYQGTYFGSGRGTDAEIWLADNISYPYNELLGVAVELGLVGLLLFVALLIISFLTKPESASRNGGGWHAALFAWVIFASFSYPLSTWGLSLLPVVIVANLAKRSGTITSFTGRRLSLAYLLLVLVASGFLLRWGYNAHRANNYVTRGHEAYQREQYDLATEAYTSAVNFTPHSGPLLQMLGKSLNEQNRLPKSQEVLIKATDYRMDAQLHLHLGDNYRVLKDYDNAISAYRNASDMIPNRLYPRYLLAITYQASGRKAAFVELATDLLAQPSKISSPAEREMKMELQKLLDKTN